MAERGFIRDDLERKALILYLSDRVIQPVSFDTLLDLALCDEGMDYFSFSQCLSELVKTKHLTVNDADGLYAITDKGRRNGAICESALPRSVRLRCDRNLQRCNRALRRSRQVQASLIPRRDGVYTLSLSLEDDAGSILELKLMVPREEMGRQLSRRFRRTPEQLYRRILDALMREDDPSLP